MKTVTASTVFLLLGALFGFIYGFHIFYTGPNFSVQTEHIESILLKICIVCYTIGVIFKVNGDEV